MDQRHCSCWGVNWYSYAANKDGAQFHYLLIFTCFIAVLVNTIKWSKLTQMEYFCVHEYIMPLLELNQDLCLLTTVLKWSIPHAVWTFPKRSISHIVQKLFQWNNSHVIQTVLSLKKKSQCFCKDIFEIEHFPYCTDSFHVEQTFPVL